MLYYRVQGLKSVYYGLLMAALTAIFWIYLLTLENFINPKHGYDNTQYVVYNLVAVAALALAAMNSRKIHDCLLRSDLNSNHRIALMNAAYVAIAVLSVSVLTKDSSVSRLFLFSLFPLLYFIFLLGHQFIPGVLVRNFFSKRHQQRALLVGPSVKIGHMARWCEQTSVLGVDVRSLVLDSEDGSSEGSMSRLKILEEAIKQGRISQIVLLELPSCREQFDEMDGKIASLKAKLKALT